MTEITDNSLVSIITPVLNGIKYLEPCLQSVLNQSYPHIDHIFVDGGSTDGTLDILRDYQTQYPERIRFISKTDNSAGEAWNKGLKIAKGEILGWLGSDDTYEIDTVRKVVSFFSSNKRAFFVFGNCNYINETGEVIGRPLAKEFDLNEAINSMCPIPCSSAFYRREVIDKVGFLDTRERGVELDYWIRVGKVLRIYRIEEVLSNFRVHPGAFSFSKEAAKIYAREGFIVSRRHGGKLISRRSFIYFTYKSVVFSWVKPTLTFLYHILQKMRVLK
ncbi:glycosyltransferase family 2 protein [Chloroflexota bacterium]